jgi:hypothetical protein
MPYEISQPNGHHTFYLKLQGKVGVAEFREALEAIAEQLQQRIDATNLLIDAQEMTDAPHDVAALDEAVSHLEMPMLNWIVLVSTDKYARYLGYRLSQNNKLNFRATNSVEHAYDFLSVVGLTEKTAI